MEYRKKYNRLIGDLKDSHSEIRKIYTNGTIRDLIIAIGKPPYGFTYDDVIQIFSDDEIISDHNVHPLFWYVPDRFVRDYVDPVEIDRSIGQQKRF